MLQAIGKRRIISAALIESLFVAASRLGRLHPLSRPERHGVEVIRDIAYAPDSPLVEHRLDIYRPRDVGSPLPAVLYVHGGGFRILSKDTHWLMALAFARRGYVVFNMSYRLAPEHPFPAAVEDVALAYQWVVEHASEWGADGNSLILAGESAGANLVTAITLAAVYQRPEAFARKVWETGVVPKAVLPACGLFQVSDIDRFRRRKPKLSRFIANRLSGIERAYLGRNHEEHGSTLDFADILPWLERAETPDRPLPPFFIPVGTRDPILPDTRRLAAALEAHGGKAEARYYPGELHAFHALVFLRSARRCWRDTFAFLREHASSEGAGATSLQARSA